MTELHDIYTTMVSGIKCNKCKTYLPPMLMIDHLEGRFNTQCDSRHLLPRPDAICKLRDEVGINDILVAQCPDGDCLHHSRVQKINKITYTCRPTTMWGVLTSNNTYLVAKQDVMFVAPIVKSHPLKLTETHGHGKTEAPPSSGTSP